MRILIYSYHFLPTIGGLQTNVDRLARYLTTKGIEAIVATQSADPMGTNYGYEVVRSCSPLALWQLMCRADVVHLAGFATTAGLLALGSGRPVLWDHYDYDTICPKNVAWNRRQSCQFSPSPCFFCLRNDFSKKEILNMLPKFSVRNLIVPYADAHVVHNQFQARRLGLPRTRTAVILYGVETNQFLPLIRSPLVEAATGTPNLLFLGRLIPEKGAHVLLEAFVQLRRAGIDAEITVCGDGPERPRLEHQCVELQIERSVHFLGNQSREGVLHALAQAAVVVVPSLWDDNAPITAIEAMSAGKPVVASNGGGLAEIIADCGFLFPRGDTSALAAILAQLCQVPEMRIRAGRIAAAHARRHHDYNVMGQQYCDLYQALIAGSKVLCPSL